MEAIAIDGDQRAACVRNGRSTNDEDVFWVSPFVESNPTHLDGSMVVMAMTVVVWARVCVAGAEGSAPGWFEMNPL